MERYLKSDDGSTGGMRRFALLVTWGSFLLFQVQPLLGKAILPTFGGSPAVWTACLLFFQSTLLLGYLYAHGLVHLVAPRWQWSIHLTLLFGAWLTLPFSTKPSELFSGATDPTWQVLIILTTRVGLPFLLLSATAPLMQHWSQVSTGQSAYRLYAASNAGSLLGLWIYPLIWEPTLRLEEQARYWSWGMGLLTILILSIGRTLWPYSWRTNDESVARPTDGRPPVVLTAPDGLQYGLWIVFSSCGSAMLVATTSLLSQDIAPVPFLWVLPLSVYLVSFIWCFLGDWAYHRRAAVASWLLAVLFVLWTLTAGVRIYRQLGWQVAVFLFALAAVCWICHGELYRSRPPAPWLTRFYLAVSLGGVAGSACVTFLAPRLFVAYYEFYLTMVATAAAVWIASRLESLSKTRPSDRRSHGLRMGLSLITMLLLTMGLWAASERWAAEPDAATNHLATPAARNFYGVLRVVRSEEHDPQRARVALLHGSTVHGYQLLNPDFRQVPTAYFHRHSGIGLVISELQHRRRETPLRMGVVGLGTGTLATYARPQDFVRFYEINPLVVQFAEDHFTFLRDARARGVQIESVIGDARAQLAREVPLPDRPRYDLLVMDAFSGDSVPMHLLSLEAMQLYWRHLTDEGVLAIQVTNRNVQLTPVIRTLSKRLKLVAVRISTQPRATDGPEAFLGNSRWMLLAKNADLFQSPSLALRIDSWSTGDEREVLWTDDFSSLLPVLE